MIIFLYVYIFLSLNFDQFSQKSIFGEGGEIFEMWRKPEVELFLRVYLYNVTNAEEFMKGTDKKIKVSQVGPYVYK